MAYTDGSRRAGSRKTSLTIGTRQRRERDMKRIVLFTPATAVMQGCAPDGPLGTVCTFVEPWM